MAISNPSDFKIYNDQLQAGYEDARGQFQAAFNAGSNGAIVLTSEDKKGHFAQEAFFQDFSANLIRRQDITSNSAVTPEKMQQAENVSVKLHRIIKPYSVTRNAFNLIGQDPEYSSFLIGQNVAKAIPVDQLNTGLSAAVAAIKGNAAMVNDVTGDDGTVDIENLMNTLAKYGDAYNSVAAWVMHSKAFFSLGLDAIDKSVDSVVAGVIRVLDIPALGRPIIVTDSPALLNATPNPDQLHVLGLAAGAITIHDNGTPFITSDTVLGNEQIEILIQGEYDYNLGLKGYAYDMTDGINPTDATVATSGSWLKTAATDKSTAGVLLIAE